LSTAAEVSKSKDRTYWVLFLSLGLMGCGLDLLSKHLVFSLLGRERQVLWLWTDYVGFQTAVNTGALFGLGRDRVGILACVSVVAIAAIVYWYATSGAARDLLMTVALGGVTGGVLGNLYDRLGLWGGYGVRDWILLRYGRFTWPNFNVADSLLVLGALMLICHALRAGGDETSDAGPP
jgi:signal peptidase II